MKNFKELAQDIVTRMEDAPANAVGTGANVALPPAVEPGVKKKEKDMKSIIIGALKRKLKENNDNNNIMLKQVLDGIDKVEVKIDAMNGITNTVDVEVEKTKPTFKEKYKI
jgi:hypothetical protein|tara:strand:+ start:278 stop:610 length:333 start_codon:yes stop_codon:yes gene_type:complete